jgi:hypothetical protein
MTDKHSAGDAADHDRSQSPAARMANDRSPASNTPDHTHTLAERRPA